MFTVNSQWSTAFPEEQSTAASKDGILSPSCKIHLSWQLWKRLLPVLICNANLPADHANMAQQLDREGANCAEVAHSNMRAYNCILGMCEEPFAYRFRCFSEVMEQLLAGIRAVSTARTHNIYSFFYDSCLFAHSCLYLDTHHTAPIHLSQNCPSTH